MAKNLVDLPFIIVVTICYALLSYKLNHQIDDNYRMLSYIALSIIVMLCGQGLAFLISTLCTNTKLACVLFLTIVVNFGLLSGYFVPLNEMQFQWLPHISYTKQVYENKLIILYGFDRCPEGQTQFTLFLMNLNEYTEHKFLINCLLLVFYIILFRIIALLTLIARANSITFLFSRK